MSTTQTDTPEQTDRKSEDRPERQPLLQLSTTPERPSITIDDVPHYLRLREDFGALEHREFNRNTEEYDELWSRKVKLNKQQEKRYQQLLDWLFDTVLIDGKGFREAYAGDDPRTGKPLLTGAVKREVVLTFTNAPLLMDAMAQMQTDMPGNSSTTES